MQLWADVDLEPRTAGLRFRDQGGYLEFSKVEQPRQLERPPLVEIDS